MRCLLLFGLGWLLLATPAYPAVELGLEGGETTVIRDVYQRNGVSFIAVKEILAPLGLTGTWDSSKHLYRIHTASGDLLISPASRYLRLGSRVAALKQKPRFIGGQLRIPEEVLTTQLPRLLGLAVIYRSLDSNVIVSPDEELLAVTATRKPIRGLRQIVIDPGHGGTDPGAIGLGGEKEKDLVLALGLRLEKLLKMENDVPVFLTRNADYAIALKERSREGNGWPEENLLLSLHLGASLNPETRGCVIFIPPQLPGMEATDPDPEARLAELLAIELQREGLPVREILRFPLLPLMENSYPAALLEFGFLTNPEELRLLSSDEGQQRIARALYQGVRHYANYLKETY